MTRIADKFFTAFDPRRKRSQMVNTATTDKSETAMELIVSSITPITNNIRDAALAKKISRMEFQPITDKYCKSKATSQPRLPKNGLVEVTLSIPYFAVAGITASDIKNIPIIEPAVKAAIPIFAFK